ncbi:hypothetical protein [Massilia sp. TSP1-1-2]|uniref:hypothetical protein n=1 Tax=unclassified Massilia TaxID=2609279 RepID=UPI003CEA1390
MAIDLTNSPSTAPGLPPQPELLVSSALHLMTHYSAQAGQAGACVKLASVIERHLKALAGHGDLNPVLRATCQQLSEQWALVVDKAMPRPTRPKLFPSFGPRSH